MIEGCPIFSAVLRGLSVMQDDLDALHLEMNNIRMMIPREIGERIEGELMRTKRRKWAAYSAGIEVVCDGQMKQLHICCGTIIAWKLGQIRKRKIPSAVNPKDIFK